MYAHLTERKFSEVTQPKFTCLKWTMERPEECVKYSKFRGVFRTQLKLSAFVC